MKTLRVLLLSIILTACGTVKIIYDPLIFEEVIKNKSNNNELYIIANSWLIESFKNSKYVIQFTDKEDGIIIGKFLMYLFPLSNDEVWAIITIRVRDNESKITIDPFGSTTEKKKLIPKTNDNDPLYSGVAIEPVFTLKDAENLSKLLIEDYKEYLRNYKYEW